VRWPCPQWRPTHVEDIDEIVERHAEYTDHRRTFVVFKWGTVVSSDSAISRPDGDYIATLMWVVNHSPDFQVIPMSDENLVVRFRGPVSGVVLRSFFVLHSTEIYDGVDAGGTLPSEHLMSAAGRIDQEAYYVGLYARAKLYRDAEEQVIARRSVPKAPTDGCTR
jgi:hypothetical protein